MKRLRPLEHWGRGFEYHSGHGCLCAFILCLCCRVCVGSSLATGWSPAKGVLPTVYKFKKPKKRQGPKGFRALEREKNIYYTSTYVWGRILSCVTSCILLGFNLRFERKYYFHLHSCRIIQTAIYRQPAKSSMPVACFACSSTLKTEVVCYSETSANFY
jgi:hypothetical protein